MSRPAAAEGEARVETSGTTADRVVLARGLSVRYGRHRVLEDIDVTVDRGEVYALLGRNGSGKSSLLRCLLGQQRPTRGETLLLGRPAWRERRGLMERVGVVPETPDVPPGWTVAQAARFAAALSPRWDRDAVEERLRRFGVARKALFGRLSRGQKTQVMLSLALGHRPELLVLDDPTLGLDVVARDAVFAELVDELAERGTTVLLTSHDLRGVESVATRVGLLAGTRLVVDEDLDALKSRFRRLRFREDDDGSVGLDAFEPVRRDRRGRLTDTVVSRWSEGARADLPPDAEVTGLSLDAIVLALAEREEGRAG